MTAIQARRDHSWVVNAKCAADPPDSLFVKGSAQRQVRQRCLTCPVRLECLVDALECQANYGVWGGLTERERRAVLRRHQDVVDWQMWLDESDDELAVQLRSGRVPKVATVNRGRK